MYAIMIRGCGRRRRRSSRSELICLAVLQSVDGAEWWRYSPREKRRDGVKKKKIFGIVFSVF